MIVHPRVIGAMVKKDVLGLLPLVALALAVFFLTPVIAGLDLANISGDTEFWLMLQRNIYWVGFFLGVLLMVSVLQLDPADSLNHDWLSRPISRTDWLLAKLAFMLVTIVLPVLAARVLVHLGSGLGLGFSLTYAAGVEELEATLLAPLLFAAALLTPSLRRLIGLLVIVFIVFLLPGWSVTRPILAALGVELGSEFGALMWTQGLVVFLAGIAGSILIYWFQYCRRQARRAYLSFWGAVMVLFFAVYPPGSLYNWDRAIALNTAMINDDDGAALVDAVTLETSLACFPAALLDGDDTQEQDNELLAQAAWPDTYLQRAGPGAMTFATTVRYPESLVEWFAPAEANRDISIEWRVDHIRARARFTADSLSEDIVLYHSPTAANRYDPIAATETDYWLVPAAAVEALAVDPSTQLVIEYDLALLKPKSYELPVDGHRYRFPGLGSCRAELDRAGNVVEIECLKRGRRPALVSAELVGLDSSRVDSAFRASFTPGWIEALSREQFELTLSSPSLVDASSVIVSAYEVQRLLQERVISPGLLGDSREICPLPSAADHGTIERSNWSDKSSHEVSSVAVERGVRVEVLDWRRGDNPAAPTLFLLPGLGATAHSYDEIAVNLAADFNVVGMTRRGAGDSSKPDRGYDIARLSRDVLQVMDTFGIDSAILVGHSIGGEELNYLGAHHAERVDGLVYLDAAYDRVRLNSGETYKRRRQLDFSLPQAPPIRPAEAVSYAAMRAYAERTGRGRNVPEGEIIASYDLNTGAIKHDELYLDAMLQGLQAPKYDAIAAPALALYAVPSSAEALMQAWYDEEDPAVQSAVQELFEMERASKLAEIARFDSEVPDSEVLVLDDANHWIFVSHPDEVLAAMRRFVERVTTRR